MRVFVITQNEKKMKNLTNKVCQGLKILLFCMIVFERTYEKKFNVWFGFNRRMGEGERVIVCVLKLFSPKFYCSFGHTHQWVMSCQVSSN